MKQLLLLALEQRKYSSLFLATAISLILLTLTSQMEICTLGIMANKGPSVFELFGSEQANTEVYLQEIEQKWSAVDVSGKGFISRSDAADYVAKSGKSRFLERLISWLDYKLDISHNVAMLAFVLIFVALSKALAMAFQRFCVRLVSIRVSKDLRERYFDHLQKLPMQFYQRHSVGALSARVVTDANAVAEALNSFLVNFLQLPFALVTTAALCVATSPQLSLLVFCGFPIIVVPVLYLAKKIRKVARTMQRNQEAFSDVLLDFLSGIQTVKLFSMEPYSKGRYGEQNEKMAKLQRKAARYDASSRPIIHTIAMAFLGFAMLYGLHVLQMEVAELFFFCGLLYLFYEPIKKFAENNHTIQHGVAAADRIQDVLLLRPEKTQKDGKRQLDKFENQIRFENVWFSYHEEQEGPDQWILKGVSFAVHKGEKVAIVGPTGSGKSTIVQLICRLYDVQKGKITIDDESITKFTFSSLRSQMSVVPQKPFLFLDTVSENISYGRDIGTKKMQEAARQAHALEFIQELPGGFDAMLSEGGKNLSGGQQQRLAIARALAKDAPILIMDEATSSLDNVSEQCIKDAMHELKGKLTQIVIAHRLTTIADADRIVFIQDGKVLAEGTREELLQSCESFRVMWEMKEKEE